MRSNFDARVGATTTYCRTMTQHSVFRAITMRHRPGRPFRKLDGTDLARCVVGACASVRVIPAPSSHRGLWVRWLSRRPLAFAQDCGARKRKSSSETACTGFWSGHSPLSWERSSRLLRLSHWRVSWRRRPDRSDHLLRSPARTSLRSILIACSAVTGSRKETSITPDRRRRVTCSPPQAMPGCSRMIALIWCDSWLPVQESRHRRSNSGSMR